MPGAPPGGWLAGRGARLAAHPPKLASSPPHPPTPPTHPHASHRLDWRLPALHLRAAGAGVLAGNEERGASSAVRPRGGQGEPTAPPFPAPPSLPCCKGGGRAGRCTAPPTPPCLLPTEAPHCPALALSSRSLPPCPPLPHPHTEPDHCHRRVCACAAARACPPGPLPITAGGCHGCCGGGLRRHACLGRPPSMHPAAEPRRGGRGAGK